MSTASALDGDVTRALPALVAARRHARADVEDWLSVPDLLESGPFDDHFVAEIDDDGRALLRFGDDQYGRSLRRGRVARRSSTASATDARATSDATSIVHVAPAVDRRSDHGAAQSARRHATAPIPRRSSTSGSSRRRPSTPSCSGRSPRTDWAQAARRQPGVAGAAATLPLDRELDDDLRRRRPAGPRRPRRPPERPDALDPASSDASARSSPATGSPATTSSCARRASCRST